ncbi:MAG: hypothetical protein ACT4O5_09705 [Gammaproteobacteria bacterium]
MIDGTRKKLREAEFFLTRLEEEERRIVKGHGETSDFYLSAFLSAARCVTLKLQFEAKPQYDAWFPSWFAALSDDDRVLMRFHNEQRRLTVHEDGPAVSISTESLPAWRLQAEMEAGGGSFDFWSGVPGTPPLEVEKRSLAFDTEPATASCRRYLHLLQQLIRDFDAQIVV